MGIEAAIVAAALAGGAGSALSSRKGARTETRDSTPIRDPAFGPLQSQLLKQVLGRLQNPTQVARGIEEQGIDRINSTFDLGRQSLQSRLTSSGLGGSGVAGNAISQLETGRLGQVGQFRSGIPLLQQQLQQQDFGNALRLFSQERRGNAGAFDPGGSALGAGLGAAGNIGGMFAALEKLTDKG